MSDADVLLTTRQLQNLLQVDRVTIYRMLEAGRLQGFKIGGQWRFSRQDFEQWLQEQRTSTAEPQIAGSGVDRAPAPQVLPEAGLRAIQEIFAEALGVATVITAADGSPLTPVVHSCQFCDLILACAAGRERCAASWRAAARKPGAMPQPVTCHAGLGYVWGRIEIDGRFVAAVHAGQFLDAPPDAGRWSARLHEVSASTGASVQALEQALGDVPVLDDRRRQQIPRLLQQTALAFSEIGEDRLDLLGRLDRIAELSRSALDSQGRT
jgi:excisionase family DNA binding protein